MLQSLGTWWRELPNGFRVVGLAIAGVLALVMVVRALHEPQLAVEELLQAWRPDISALGNLNHRNPLLLPKDIPEIEQFFSSLRIDLREESAHITWGTKTWTGTWSPTPATGSAPAIRVDWGKGSPVGRATNFSRDGSMIILSMEAGEVPLRIDEENAP